MVLEKQLLVFLFLVIGGVVLEGIVSSFYYRNKKRNNKNFSFTRYLLLLLLPTIAAFVTFFMIGEPAIKIFLTFSLLGPIIEWCIGFSYQAIVGQKLWTYHRYSITGNTSLLAIPIWGLAGILFYYLAHIF
jgi:hypothetical protein